MRASSFLLPASLLALAGAAAAQELPYPQPDTAPMSTVQVTRSAPTLPIREDQAEQIVGSYAMSNGWRLKVQPATRHIEATIDRQRPMRLYAVAPYRFATRDDKVRMEFNLGPRGEDMRMSYLPEQRLAWVVVSSVPVASR